LRAKLNLSLHIVHLDHGLRPDSAADAEFVKSWAQKLNLPITVKRVNPQSFKQKGSLEELGRNARLDFFLHTAKKIKASKVALGHNLDDQAETVLMRLLRGTGLSGLAAIALKREIKGVVFIRPLLETTRKQIESYLKRRKIKPRRDFTNQQDLYFRNKIRHHLLPLLKNKYNRNIVEALANLAETAGLDYEYLNQVAKRAIIGKNGQLKIRAALKLHPSILRLKIRESIARVQGDTRRIGFVHIKEIESLLNHRPIGSIVDLPKGISVQRRNNSLRFYQHKS